MLLLVQTYHIIENIEYIDSSVYLDRTSRNVSNIWMRLVEFKVCKYFIQKKLFLFSHITKKSFNLKIQWMARVYVCRYMVLFILFMLMQSWSTWFIFILLAFHVNRKKKGKGAKIWTCKRYKKKPRAKSNEITRPTHIH